MRILIASFWGIPGRSGAWSTPIDLLGRDHKLTYVMHRGKPGYYYLEGVEVFGPNMRMPWPGNGRLNEVVERVNARLYQRRLKDVVARGGYDCLFCIDLIAARCAQRLGYKYVLRLHDYPSQESRIQRAVEVRMDREQFISTMDTAKLYDLTQDPRELRNVHGSDEYAAVQSTLEQALLDWYVTTSDIVPLQEYPRDLPQEYVVK